MMREEKYYVSVILLMEFLATIPDNLLHLSILDVFSEVFAEKVVEEIRISETEKSI
jgi:bisphosphoglycerate-independent phosphoglycerate mutase (AlkP superfamily)